MIGTKTKHYLISLCFFAAIPSLSKIWEKTPSEITLYGEKATAYLKDGDTFTILDDKLKQSFGRVAAFNTLKTNAPIDSLSKNSERIPCEITIDGEKAAVYFNDGDTFKILDGKFKKSSVRVAGFNTLETYGPVHSWSKNSPTYLLDMANQATKLAQEGGWNCTLEPGQDFYGRLLATCDDLAFALLSQGLAHAYSINKSPASKSYIAKQKAAQKKKLGMWKGGVPSFIIASLHSTDEGAKKTYNRMISTKDGHTERWQHDDSYGTCENVCLEQDESCMIYVPFGQRYGKNKPKCLFTKKRRK